jgi:dTDP-4-amino-4,6-dideoxygalactose transaminase
MTVDRVPYLDLSAQLRPIRAEVDAALARALDNNTFCLGPDVVAFEKEFAEFCGVKHCIAMNSGTSALHIALMLLNVGPGDEVITTPYTFAATSWAISYVGAKPVYVDIDPVTFNLDPALVEKAITPRTKAILPVHLYGHPFDIEALAAIGKKHGLPIVEDAAQAVAATFKGKRVGGFGASACFSFYPAKNLGAIGEAGALVTNDDAAAVRAKALREHGSKVRYHHDEVGFNYRMEGIQGAVLRVKLKHIDAWTKRRQAIAHRYQGLLKDTPLTLPVENAGYDSAWHLFTVRHARRDELKAFLETNGIGSAIHYPLPLHLQECYKSLGYKLGDFPVSEAAAKTCLSLPVFPELTDAQVDRVAEVVKQFFAA